MSFDCCNTALSQVRQLDVCEALEKSIGSLGGIVNARADNWRVDCRESVVVCGCAIGLRVRLSEAKGHGSHEAVIATSLAISSRFIPSTQITTVADNVRNACGHADLAARRGSGSREKACASNACGVQSTVIHERKIHIGNCREVIFTTACTCRAVGTPNRCLHSDNGALRVAAKDTPGIDTSASDSSVVIYE